MKKAFTLVELMIIVAILGIIAAIALPQFQTHTQQAKESAAKESLRILRNAIELYSIQHNDVPPGYPNGDVTAAPSVTVLVYQLCTATKATGEYAAVGTAGYDLGPYIPKFPENPFNNLTSIDLLNNIEDMPTGATGNFGWIYKPATKNIRLDWPGTDTDGQDYYNY